MKRKITIILSFIILFSMVIPYSYGLQNIQYINKTTNANSDSKDIGSVEIPYQEGWPQKTNGKIDCSPVIADLDNDGMMEILIGSGNDFYAYHSDGTLMVGWPIEVIKKVFGSPAVGDLDDDDDLEIVVTVKSGATYAWHHDGTAMDGWPVSTGYCLSAPTLYDLDDDGDLEVIVGNREYVDGNSCATIDIWHHDGTPMDGWPKVITDYEYSVKEYGSCAVGDIDNDDDAEIVVGIRTERYGEPSYGQIYAWHHTGELLLGWPVPTGKFGDVQASPVLGDLDDDEDLEIIVGANNGNIMALHHDGTYVDGWPIDINSWLIDGQATADIDQDGVLDIISGSYAYGHVYAWHPDGSALSGWPQDTDGNVIESPVIGDIYGDDHLEVLITSTDSKLHAWCHNGTRVPGFPLVTGNGSGTTPCFGDIDGDSDIELIVGTTDKFIYIWDLPADFHEEGMEWPMYQHDLYHTGCYGFGEGFTADANGPYYGRLGREIEFIASTINGEPPFIYDWDFGDGSSSSLRKPVHLYETVGEYMVNLTVIDSLGKTAFDVDRVEMSSFGRVEYRAIRIKEIHGGIGITAVIENSGMVDANGVEWSIQVDESTLIYEGSLLLPMDGIKSGIINIPAGKTRSVWCPVLYDISIVPWLNLDVQVTSRIENCIDQEIVAKGAIIFFVIPL